MPELRVAPTAVQLFAFSAATWNTHRIHYDADYARDVEGYPGVLVQSHLYGCVLVQAVRAAFGNAPELLAVGWQNRGAAFPGDELTVTGTAADRLIGADGTDVRLVLEVRNQDAELCIRGWATLRFATEGGRG